MAVAGVAAMMYSIESVLVLLGEGGVFDEIGWERSGPVDLR